jgi:hypothetical protein
MKKFNLFKEIIIVSKSDFLRAANSAKPFAIAYNGEIHFEPFPQSLISIYEGSIPPLSPLSTDLSRPLTSMLGDKYRIVEDDERILIKAFGAWQNIIGFNRLRALYDDTTADGIDKFSDKELEKIGWHATEFNISYRDIVEQFEKECEGILFCIEQEDPYQFSGLGFLSDLEHTQETAYKYCTAIIKDKMENDGDYSTLTDDEAEAAEFFKVI